MVLSTWATVVVLLMSLAVNWVASAIFISWRVGREVGNYEQRISAFGKEIEGLRQNLKDARDESDTIMTQFVNLRVRFAALTGQANGETYRKGGC